MIVGTTLVSMKEILLPYLTPKDIIGGEVERRVELESFLDTMYNRLLLHKVLNLLTSPSIPMPKTKAFPLNNQQAKKSLPIHHPPVPLTTPFP